MKVKLNFLLRLAEHCRDAGSPFKLIAWLLLLVPVVVFTLGLIFEPKMAGIVLLTSPVWLLLSLAAAIVACICRLLNR